MVTSYAIQERAVSTNPDAGPQGKGWQEDIAFTLEARNKVQAVVTTSHDNDNRPVAATASNTATPADNDKPLRFLSVCSGIEAASVAWHPLGWQAVAFSEIEKFPSAVLAHHYPDVPNLGDFTKIDTRTLGRVDIFCGGTPCQAFSVAGLRQSLADERGNLSLEFVRLAHELADGNGLRNVVWENVPGVLSTKDNAFGCFLAGLVGADSQLVPQNAVWGAICHFDGGSYDVHRTYGWKRCTWPSQGMVSGPKGRAAWAIKDGQFFGVAQRRRRVIVVADFGIGADPAAVLFEPESLPRHSPPSREEGQGVARGFEVGPGGSGFADVATTMDCRAKNGSVQNQIGVGVAHVPEIARCDATREGSSQDYETTTMVAVEVAPTMRAGGNSTGGDRPYGTDVDTCDSLAVVRQQMYSIMPQNSGKDYKARPVDVTQALMAGGPVGGNQGGDVIVAFDTTQITSKANRSSPKAGDPCHPLAAGAHPPALAFQSSQSGVRLDDVHATLDSNNGSRRHNGALHGSAVRRLTPVECERLQGFPDGYTDIPWRGKPTSPDGPRYKALGNSWAVPKFAWLGRRISALMPGATAANDNKDTSLAA